LSETDRKEHCMELDELMALIDIDEPAGFEYFENFAEIAEADLEIPEETLYALFSQTDPGTVSDLIGNYFEEILRAMPDDGTDAYILLDNIGRSLSGLMLSDEERAKVYFSEELARFHRWYTKESEVSCTSQETGHEQILPLRDALTLARLERLDGEPHGYDFTGCLDYEIDEFIMNFAIDREEE
ncbi:MAG: hypothetical protein II682_06750, partial [Firmicutes bacterium]|nr:hypothetical protein [Bacillota bacterium]